jgi:soluble lytic murein transglycosylase-like protein
VSLLTLSRRARISAAAVLVGATLSGVPAFLPSAHADTSGEVGAQVQTLLGKVHSLQAKADAAERKYAKAASAVAQSVNASINDQQSSAAVAAQAADAQQELAAKVRGLYESGGSFAAFASVITSGDATAAADQSVVASRVIDEQIASVNSISAKAAKAQSAANQASGVEKERILAENAVEIAASSVQLLLDQQKALLSKANKKLAAVRKAEAALAAETVDLGTLSSSAIAGLHVLQPSPQFLALYQHAGPTCPGLPWTILAAIGQVESGHGRNDGPSSAGAEGPMQFEPATFAAYAVDGDHDGSASIMDPADSIYTAAHYLCANGAGHSQGALSSAILHYNHAEWYVQEVEKLANLYASAYA